LRSAGPRHDYPPQDLPGITDTSPLQPNRVGQSWRPVDLPLKDDFKDFGHALTVTRDITDQTSIKSITAYREDESNFSFDPSATIDYRWTDALHTYTKFSQGYRAGGFNLYNVVLQPFRPESLSAWEVGLESSWWGDRLRFNIDGFSQDYRDIQVNTVTLDPVLHSLVTVTENLGHRRSWKPSSRNSDDCHRRSRGEQLKTRFVAGTVTIF
jgi:outer membrane receptor protein involved in Fe transport